MTIIGIDDTDSRERGMCTTYIGARIAARCADEAAVERRLLVRLNPAVEHKTRGNAAVAVHTSLDPGRAFEIARTELDRAAETADPNTNPGLVVAPGAPGDVTEAVAAFARDAIRGFHAVEDALALAGDAGYRTAQWKNGRGTIGALAAVGAWAALDDWTYERIAYREPARWGTHREIDADSLFAAADAGYPDVWDTVDRGTGDLVCVPRTPCPILHGIRGDDPDAVRRVSRAIGGEPVHGGALFVTNQGTDAHLRDGTITDVVDGRAYRVPGTVASAPETREGGHVFLSIRDGEATLDCVAFEPTKRFRDRVRALRAGDRLTACGEVSGGVLKLEKFRVHELNRTRLENPTCPGCGRSMESAGRDQGYRCRDCGTRADGKVERRIDRALEPGWYEVPPAARRHVAKPLVRGGFGGPVHPEK